MDCLVSLVGNMRCLTQKGRLDGPFEIASLSLCSDQKETHDSCWAWNGRVKEKMLKKNNKSGIQKQAVWQSGKKIWHAVCSRWLNIPLERTPQSWGPSCLELPYSSRNNRVLRSVTAPLLVFAKLPMVIKCSVSGTTQQLHCCYSSAGQSVWAGVKQLITILAGV